jgi:Rieske [2Fe-2S] domain
MVSARLKKAKSTKTPNRESTSFCNSRLSGVTCIHCPSVRELRAHSPGSLRQLGEGNSNATEPRSRDEKCSHLGSPLSEGKLEGETIQCPWRGSRFSIRDGHVVDGPAVHPQPYLEAGLRNGQIEVRKSNCRVSQRMNRPLLRSRPSLGRRRNSGLSSKNGQNSHRRSSRTFTLAANVLSWAIGGSKRSPGTGMPRAWEPIQLRGWPPPVPVACRVQLQRRHGRRCGQPYASTCPSPLEWASRKSCSR